VHLGPVGWGETTLEGKPKSVAAAVDELADYLIGKDPLRIEHYWRSTRIGASATPRDAGRRAAQANPERFRDLVVRVAGFSAFFVNLSKDMQEEIIARTEHGG
jgi:hypothetical protein